MKMKKISIILAMCVVAFWGCNHQNELQIDDANSGNYSSTDDYPSTDDYSNKDTAGNSENTGNSAEKYSGFAKECVSKYPELITTDVAIGTSHYDPIIVSPYASEDVVRALAHIIYDEKISIYCFGNYVYDEYDDDFSNYDYEKVYEIIQSRIDEYRAQADLFMEQLKASIENDSEINISPDGEYYYLLDMNNFEESADAIQASVDRQAELFDFDMTFYCEYYFTYDDRTFNFIGGYRGPTYSIYLDNYSPENKIYEYYYWKAKHDWGRIYPDLYISKIYDYTKISEKLEVNSDYYKQLICGSNYYQSQTDSGLYEIDYTYRMSTDDFDLTEATELAYEVYTEVRSANAEYNTNEICCMRVDISNFTEYDKEYNRISVFIPFDKEYSPEELKKILEDNIEKEIDYEPV